MLECAYKDTGFVNFILESISRIAIALMKYQYFSCFHACQQSRIGAKSASSAPGPKSAPRGSKSITFAEGIFLALQPSKNCYESNRGSFRFTHSISVIPVTPSCSLRSFRNWRLVCSELHVDTDFEFYGSSIGVCN